MDVMISIQPYWVFLIIAKPMGWSVRKEKKVEIRKNFPRNESWSKVAKIYCTKNKKSFAQIPKEYQSFMEGLLGKVVGEFACDAIISHCEMANADIAEQQGCIKREELLEYAGDKELYGWHISDLVIYDEPKELWDFVKHGYPTMEQLDEEICSYCYRTEYGEKKSYSYPGGYVSCEGSYCPEAYDDYLEENWTLRRAPQSWCYVEVLPQ